VPGGRRCRHREHGRPARADQRLAGAVQAVGQRPEGDQVGLGGAGHVAGEHEVVAEREVDHAVGGGGLLAQHV